MRAAACYHAATMMADARYQLSDYASMSSNADIRHDFSPAFSLLSLLLSSYADRAIGRKYYSLFKYVADIEYIAIIAPMSLRPMMTSDIMLRSSPIGRPQMAATRSLTRCHCAPGDCLDAHSRLHTHATVSRLPTSHVLFR